MNTRTLFWICLLVGIPFFRLFEVWTIITFNGPATDIPVVNYLSIGFLVAGLTVALLYRIRTRMTHFLWIAPAFVLAISSVVYVVQTWGFIRAHQAGLWSAYVFTVGVWILASLASVATGLGLLVYRGKSLS
jgi:hypothetical protein